MCYKNLALDLNVYKVYAGKENVEFTLRKCELLQELLFHQVRFLTRQSLLQTFWNVVFLGDERIIDTHIKTYVKSLAS